MRRITKRKIAIVGGAFFWAVLMVVIAESCIHYLKPLCALGVLIAQLCICVAAFTWTLTAMWYRRKYGQGNDI